MSRNSIEDYVIEKHSNGLSENIIKILINSCKEAIVQKNNYKDIANMLLNKLDNSTIFDRNIPWNATVFPIGGTLFFYQLNHYLRIRFANLIILLFTVKQH